MLSFPTSENGKPVGPLHIILPALVMVLLFILLAVGGALPLVEDRLLTYKKDMVRELARTAVTILADYQSQAASGSISREEAQSRALHLLAGMRYGPEDKDYLWVNDFTPRMIMHPYRPDLVGRDVADYRDPDGHYLFRSFLKAARSPSGGGFVTYTWQRHDNPLRVGPKLSYVQAFAPWGWIVGTGVYIDDVQAEMAALHRRLALFSATFLVLMIIFAGYYTWQWVRVEGRRRRAWRELSESREKYEAVLESSPNAVVVYDQEGRVLYLNAAFSRIFGWTFEELIGKRIDFVPDSSRKETQEAIRTAFEKGYYSFETQRRRKDGQIIYVRISAATYRLSDGATGGMVVNLEDVSERKASELKLRESEQKYRLLTESITETIWTMNLDLAFTYLSPTSAQLQGWTPQEIMALPLEQVMPAREVAKVTAALAEELAEGQRCGDFQRSLTLELELNHKNGATLWSEVTATFMVDADGRPTGILGVTRDVSQRKQAEAEKMELLEKLSRSRKMEALGLLAGGVAHDLNNVLSGIVSYPDLILMDLPPESPLKDAVLTIRESGIKAAAIVQDLLTLARRGATAFEVLNLNAIVTDVLRSPEHQKLAAFHPDVDFQTHFEDDLPDIEGSPVHLKKTVHNLVANAAEAQPGGGLVGIFTESRYLDKPLSGYDEVAEGEYVVLRVADRGQGIAEEDLSRIFEPFYTKKVLGRSGTGLGMAVVWGTVQDHAGYIDIHSEEHQGTLFELYFPMTRKRPVEREETTSEAIRGRNETILVVDDIQEQREIASMILGRLNYAVTTVSSGEKALAFLKENDVDLVILDMMMDPGLDGLDTYRAILAIKPGQNVIIASGFAETDRVKQALELGASHYLKKPYTLENIGLVVRRELDRNSATRN